MNGHSNLIGGVEDGTITFNEQERCYEEVDGNVQVPFEERLQQLQHMLDEMINLNGKAGKSKYGYLNTKGRRSLKRLSKFLNDMGEDNGNN
jgi:hypothetical protein